MFLRGTCSSQYPPLECVSSPNLVPAASVLIPSEGAESPGSGRLGVICALVLFSASEDVGARGNGAL